MKFKRRLQADEEGIPITNLVDVLFLLIVFFMMSTVLSFDRGYGVKLPQSSAAGAISNKGVSVTIARDGKVYVDGNETPLDRLGDAVKSRQLAAGNNVILKSDRDTRFQAIADVMDRLLAVGIGDLSLPVVERSAER
ncbi:MAG: ExbD/TolR family protein [Desulfobacteria bacterium]|nr:biopolymer transporter ExbD [Deltaproteobacteria bacterium]HQT96570.1 biopolymer transporter ExbD [Thermodesulfobacteriota bacterium]